MLNDVKLIFSKFLKDARKKRNLTQAELAELSFINQRTISDMENGKSNYDLDKLESLSIVLNVDLIKKYFEIFFEDSNSIDQIINSLNNKDRIEGSSNIEEINKLVEIKNKTNRKFIELKAEKLILFFYSIKENKNVLKRQNLIVKALNINQNFDFENLEINSYEIIDYRILINYALTLNDNTEKLKIFKFIESSDLQDENTITILYHNIANLYYILDYNKTALEYINKAIENNKNSPISPVMLYTKALILSELSLPNQYYIDKSLEISKKTDTNLYNLILNKISKSINNK